MVANVLNPLNRLGQWLQSHADKNAPADRVRTFGQTADDVEEWAESIIKQGFDKFVRQPARPAPVYSFPTDEELQHNFRDVALSASVAATADGRHLKPGFVTRMDAPRETDRSRFQGKIEVDLRSAAEVKANPSPSWRATPGFGYQHFAIEPLGAYNALDKNRDLAIAKTMLLLQNGSKVVIHCTHGVDRAGMAVAMTMLALGYSKDAARDEYLLSGESPEGPQADPEVFDDAVDNTLRDHGRTASGYVSYLNTLLQQNNIADRVDQSKLREALLQ